MSKKTAEAVNATLAYEPNVLVMAVTDIEVPTEGNITRPEGTGDITDLMESIAATGQQTPVVVQRQTGEGLKPFKLAAGFCRVAAITALMRDERHDGAVLARVLVGGNEADRVLANITENENARKEISPMGRLAGYVKLQEAGYTMAQIAAITGRAEDFVRDHLRLPKGIEECRAALMADPESDEHVSWGVIRLVLRFGKEKQPEALKRVRGLSTVKAAAALKKYRDELAGKTEEVEEPEQDGEGNGGGGEDEDGPKMVRATSVAAKLYPAVPLLGDAVGALREMLAQPGELDGKEVAKVVNVIARIGIRIDENLRNLCGDEAVDAVRTKREEKQADSEAA